MCVLFCLHQHHYPALLHIRDSLHLRVAVETHASHAVVLKLQLGHKFAARPITSLFHREL